MRPRGCGYFAKEFHIKSTMLYLSHGTMNTSEVLNQCSETTKKYCKTMGEYLYVSPRGRMLVVNLIFMISGVVTLALGLYVYFVFDEYIEMLYSYQALPLFYISTAVIIFVMLLLGLFARKNSRHLAKKMYIGALFIIFIFHVAASMAGFVYQVDIKYNVWNELRERFPMYRAGHYYYESYFVDKIQRDFRCCGVDNFKEWPSILNTTDTGGVPLSCCTFYTGAVYLAECTVNNANWGGCGDMVGYYFANYMLVIGITAAVLAGVQGLLILLVMWAKNAAKRQEHDEKELLSRAADSG